MKQPTDSAICSQFYSTARFTLHSGVSSEINPTRCNNCVYSSQWLYSTCFSTQRHMFQHSEAQHGITRQGSPTTQHDLQR